MLRSRVRSAQGSTVPLPGASGCSTGDRAAAGLRLTARSPAPVPGPLLEALHAAPAGVFCQYASADPALDLPDAAERRLENLARYLEAFGRARWLLVGEAAGFRAGRFTGVPFTDETQLVGPRPLPWAGQANGFRRTSRPERPLLREASATVVWSALGERRDVALWNVVPWHPPGSRGPLSNALPSREARRAGLAVLKLALEVVWPDARPIAVGRVAEQALRELGIAGPSYLRHPGHGGNVAFTSGLLDLLQRAEGGRSTKSQARRHPLQT